MEATMECVLPFMTQSESVLLLSSTENRQSHNIVPMRGGRSMLHRAQ